MASGRGSHLLLLLAVPLLLPRSAAPEKSCRPPPPSYPSAQPKSPSWSRSSYYSGERVFYNCATGYTPGAARPFAKCSDGQWTALNVPCERKSCGSAGDIINGYFKYEGESLFGDKAFAMCNDGYWIKGDAFRTCGDEGWEGDLASCERERPEISCPSPSVANGVSINGMGTSYRPTDSVSFACREGFDLKGPREITCGPDGKWDAQPPQCLPPADREGCGPPESYPNMRRVNMHSEQQLFALNSRVTYECGMGYMRAKGIRRVSECKNGRWTQIDLICDICDISSAYTLCSSLLI